jgi:hypothetical protein
LEQPAEFQIYIQTRYQVMAMLASQAAIISASKGGTRWDCS